MLVKFIGIICLSLAAITATGSKLSNKEQPDQSPQMQGDLRNIPVTDKEIQLAFFGGLTLVFVAMVAMLFRKYKGKHRASKDYFNEGYYNSDNTTFTPTFFSSESSPAILVAQHNNDLRLFITNTLRLNYRVVSTTDGLEAFEKAVEVVPDLIITDRRMPGMDGPVLCRKLKSTEATSHIPVVILTDQEKDMLTSDWHPYADDLMFSTFDARELLMRVHNLIAARKKQQEEFRRLLRSYPIPVKENSELPEKVFLDKVLHVLKSEYSDPTFGVEQLTNKVSMTRLQLYRKLKALTTHAPGDFIRQYRLEQAKQFLMKDDSSVADVAGRTGFNNLSSFTKAFKEYTGKSPVEFAETNKTSDESLVED
jgi:DNA-binding response OmpR family regulator